MIAGAICDETDCTGLVLVILAALVVLVAVVAVVLLAWMATVSTILRRRGWGGAQRHATAFVAVVAAAVTLWRLANAVPDVAGPIALLVGLPAVPIALWQRWVTRRDQSSPCSTA